MEFNKPVSNPLLVGSIELMKAEDTPAHRNMFIGELSKASFLSPAVIEPAPEPDKDGKLDDVVLGYDDVAAYEANGCFFGALIGRHGNRIGGASFELNGVTYELEKNDGEKINESACSVPVGGLPAVRLRRTGRAEWKYRWKGERQ